MLHQITFLSVLFSMQFFLQFCYYLKWQLVF